MKVEALEREWEVKDISFAERRTLYQKQAKNFWSVNEESEMDVDAYFSMLDEVLGISGLTEEDFDGLSMTEIDQVIAQVMLAYTGLSGKGSGD
jgi:hypothetical protein|tara:strand:- start:19 stop:297 length:279 start_codon:yes stop_codon:yes gene_type:complete